jgi:hypothetical protein
MCLYKKKKKRETGSQPGLPGLTGFFRVNYQAGFYLYSDRSQARVGPPGRSGFQNCGPNNYKLN